ncbi:MAG: biotin--[acetyl-CoA-carboxylase] ligase [Treponema sp.]|nr:biotin--[acetyl-CoA-carboxylase] ligase [Treponema sp.]
MKKIEVSNPFCSPVYHEEAVDSTMNVSRKLAAGGEGHGTVIISDFQQAGRGRIRDRKWEMQRKCGLSFTVLLRFEDAGEIPQSLTLRTGLAVSSAIEECIPALKNKIKIKWPNDIIIDDKKAAGILCEASGGIVHVGIGINLTQKEFPAPIDGKATSLSLASGIDFNWVKRFLLLEKILAALYSELDGVKSSDWKKRLDRRLYKKGKRVIFIDGEADSGREVKGTLKGTGEGGELLIVPDGEKKAHSFVTGELLVTGKNPRKNNSWRC